MTRGKKNEISVASFIGVLVLGAIASVFQNAPVLGFLLVGLLIGGAVWLFMPHACDLCGSQLKRSVYQWAIDGEKKKVCPNCNRGLERRKSKEALQRL